MTDLIVNLRLIKYDSDTTVGKHLNRYPRENPNKFDDVEITI